MATTGDKESEETGRLTSAKLEEIYRELIKDSPPIDEPFEFIAFLTTWERIVCFFSARYAMKLWADRQIREWHKRQLRGENPKIWDL